MEKRGKERRMREEGRRTTGKERWRWLLSCKWNRLSRYSVLRPT